MHFAIGEALALSPGDVFGNAAAFFLRQRGHNGDEQFTLAVKGVDTLFFKVAFHAVLFQLSDGDQAVNRVSRKSADRLGNDEVNFAVQGIRDHFFEPLTALGVSAGNALVRVDFYELPFRLGLYEFGVIINLGFITGELLIAVRGNTSVSGDTSFPRCHRRQMRQWVYGCRYHCNFRHSGSSFPELFDGLLLSSRPSNFVGVSGLSISE